MKCASRPPLLSATAYCYVRTRYIGILCGQLVAKLSGITEWYTKTVQLEVRTHMQPVLRTKNCMRDK